MEYGSSQLPDGTEYQHTYEFRPDGTFVYSLDGDPNQRGTYYTSSASNNGVLNWEITEWNIPFRAYSNGAGQWLIPGWVTRDELRFLNLGADINRNIDLVFVSRSWNYSISGNTLTITRLENGRTYTSTMTRR